MGKQNGYCLYCCNNYQNEYGEHSGTQIKSELKFDVAKLSNVLLSDTEQDFG